MVKREQVAEALDVKVELVEEMEQRLGAQELSIDGRYQSEGDEGRSLTEVLADTAPSQEEIIGDAEFEEARKKCLNQALKQLSDRERLIIRRRRLSEDTQTLSEIGKDLGITRERVRQLEARAIRKLRSFLIENKFEYFTSPDTELALQC
jgi:RNA polymerase sigma-32 factor